VTNRLTAAVLIFLASVAPAGAQFKGPAAPGRVSTVEQARNAPIETYVTVTGNVIAHLREDYYSFRDESGEIRVEIDDGVWRGREVGPETRVRLLAEVDRSHNGSVYLWVKSLDPVE
jgi:uncharacterized protein (TIGR00156 family)